MYNNPCASKSGVVNNVLLGNEGNTNPDPEAPSWEPWAKWVEMQQFESLIAGVKRIQKALQKPP